VFFDVQGRGAQDRRDLECRKALVEETGSVTRRMYTHRRGVETGTPAWGSRGGGQQHEVAARPSPQGAGLRCLHGFCLHETTASVQPFFAVDITAVCTMFCSRCLGVGALDGEAEGKGETDEEANATGRGGSANRETR
jgi:hypothetical protein